jgi:integrase/recombinase XerD
MSTSDKLTSPIGTVIARYVAFKRALGLQYDCQCQVLKRFDRFLAELPAEDLTSESFAAWCASMEHQAAGGRRLRLRLVHGLCLYRRRSEPTCFVPDPSQFPPPRPPSPPHIFSEEEILRLLCAADELCPYKCSPLYPQVARLAVVLLYTAGLRRGELVRLTLGDYDSAERTLFIHDTKFHKSRIVPLSPDAVREIERYLETRRGVGIPQDVAAPLLVQRQRGFSAYQGNGLRVLMRRLFKAAGILTVAGRLPRTHDLRFTFAVHALSRWYRTGADVQSRLPALANFMGHASVVSTQYYLPFLDTVAQSASDRFDRHCERFLMLMPDERGGQ